MEDDLRSELAEDEEILWKGRPEPFITLDQTNKQPFVIKTVITVLVTTAIILTYAYYAIPMENFKIGIPVVLAAFAALIITGTFQDARKIRKLQYAITNKRLIRKGDEVRSVSFPAIRQYLFSTDEDGHTSLLIGPDAVKKKSRKWRAMGISNLYMNEETGECEEAVFYAIPQPDQFKTVFQEQVK